MRDRLAQLYNPKKLVHASVEYSDVAAIGQEALKETAFTATLRGVDALAHVVRAFDDPSIPHVGEIDPLRDIKTVELLHARHPTKRPICASLSLPR